MIFFILRRKLRVCFGVPCSRLLTREKRSLQLFLRPFFFVWIPLPPKTQVTSGS